jgi:hypothetical protein
MGLEYQIQYRKGNKNLAANTLSRRNDTERSTNKCEVRLQAVVG